MTLECGGSTPPSIQEQESFDRRFNVVVTNGVQPQPSRRERFGIRQSIAAINGGLRRAAALQDFGGELLGEQAVSKAAGWGSNPHAVAGETRAES